MGPRAAVSALQCRWRQTSTSRSSSWRCVQRQRQPAAVCPLVPRTSVLTQRGRCLLGCAERRPLRRRHQGRLHRGGPSVRRGDDSGFLAALSLPPCDPRSCSALRERRMKITQEDLRKAKDKALYRKKGNEPQVRRRTACWPSRMRAPHLSLHAGHVPLSALCAPVRSPAITSSVLRVLPWAVPCYAHDGLVVAETTGRFFHACTFCTASADASGGVGSAGKI